MLKNIIEGIELSESPVGSRGRTGRVDAQEYVDKNPELVKEFMKIVNKMGGKAVASAVLSVKSGAKNEGAKEMRECASKLQEALWLLDDAHDVCTDLKIRNEIDVHAEEINKIWKKVK